MDRFYAICGLSPFTRRMATALHEAGRDVLAIDYNPEIIQKIRDQVTKSVCADLRDRDVLKNVGALEADVVIVGLPKDFGVAVLLIHLFRESGVEKIIVEVRNDDEEEAAMVMGATQVVVPERDAADRMVKTLTLPAVTEMIALSGEAGIIEFNCPEAWVGKNVLDLDVRQEFDVYVIGVHKKSAGDSSEKGKVLLAPSPRRNFEADDLLLILGTDDRLQAFAEKMGDK